MGLPMSNPIPSCQPVKVRAFRGDRGAFAASFLKSLEDSRKHSGPGPTLTECLLWAGHAGVSTDLGNTIYGFNPKGGGIPLWELMDKLNNGEAFPGNVTDDTKVFASAHQQKLTVLSFDILLPPSRFQRFERALNAEGQGSQYQYGFPNGEGDCNCITWIERLGLPLLTGQMIEFVGVASQPKRRRRRFGLCVP